MKTKQFAGHLVLDSGFGVPVVREGGFEWVGGGARRIFKRFGDDAAREKNMERLLESLLKKKAIKNGVAFTNGAGCAALLGSMGNFALLAPVEGRLWPDAQATAYLEGYAWRMAPATCYTSGGDPLHHVMPTEFDSGIVSPLEKFIEILSRYAALRVPPAPKMGRFIR